MANITVVIVSDYRSGEARDWKDERECLRSLAAQDIPEPVEYLLCEDQRFEGTAPSELRELLPGLRILFLPVAESYALKNAGVRAAAGEFVAHLDTDCKPSANWLRAAMKTLRQDANVVAVSGCTTYEDQALPVRISALLSRSYLDPGRTGRTEFLSNNCAVVRREWYLRHPLPEGLSAFAARIQSDAMIRDGGVLWFDRAIQVTHEFEGWAMEADIRRNLGWGTVTTRLVDERLPYAALVRLGAWAIPVILAGKLWNSWRDCLRCHDYYGVRWFEVPLALGAACAVISMEVPGMWLAYRSEKITETAYR